MGEVPQFNMKSGENRQTTYVETKTSQAGVVQSPKKKKKNSPLKNKLNLILKNQDF